MTRLVHLRRRSSLPTLPCLRSADLLALLASPLAADLLPAAAYARVRSPPARLASTLAPPSATSSRSLRASSFQLLRLRSLPNEMIPSLYRDGDHRGHGITSNPVTPTSPTPVKCPPPASLAKPTQRFSRVGFASPEDDDLRARR
ncbi:hypothetical protein Syun_023851 [Stephania yunnanensis]|uniref:Uncharacterized protein n=1 Tax=Stephania yunnanensis TaxID=152371 RepID=A0AAP0FDF4_9MAGN